MGKVLTRTMAAAAGAAMLLPLAACGGSADAGKTTISFLSWDNEQIMKPFIDEFEKENPDIKVDFGYAPPTNEYIQTLQTRLVGNQAPDVFVITSENKNDLIDNGYALDMTGKSYVKKLSQANKDFLSRDGKLYGQSISSWAAGIAYNKDLLGQVGYDSVPATWDEFLDLCGKLKNKGITPYIESLGDGNDRIPDSFMGAVYAKDGVDVTTLADKTPSTPGANEKDCVKAWMKVYEKGYASRDNVGVSGDDAKTQFANGQVAMYTTGVWDFSAFEGASFDWGFARIPALDKNHEQYSQGSPSAWSDHLFQAQGRQAQGGREVPRLHGLRLGIEAAQQERRRHHRRRIRFRRSKAVQGDLRREREDWQVLPVHELLQEARCAFVRQHRRNPAARPRFNQRRPVGQEHR